MQSFMVWKYPSRVHEHKKAVQPDPDEWKLTQERFYDDYTDDKNSEYNLPSHFTESCSMPFCS